MITLVYRGFAWFTFVLFALSTVQSQNTVGLIKYDPASTYEGYNLFYPNNQSTAFLTNNCGELVHTWADEVGYRPGNMVYILEDGSLVRCKRWFNFMEDTIWAGGGGAFVERVDWNNKLIWSFEQNNAQARLHHDVAPMPNGNVLMISWELRSLEQCILAGRDPSSLLQDKLWPDYILEYDPNLDSVVWEWHVWDHLIQDFDSTKENYGVVGIHPELVNINYQSNEGHPDWLHTNSIDYHPGLDQILISVPTLGEIWIIDHSTSTQEAASHSGGEYGLGGDLLFRWGNPQVYAKEAPQKLFGAHDARWIDDFLSKDQRDYGAISVFNNQAGPDYSTVNIIIPVLSNDSVMYLSNDKDEFLPEDFERTITHPDTFSLHSSTVSSAQVLPNDNFLVCSGRWGWVFEIDAAANNVVWEYRVPLRAGQPISQGDELNIVDNITFRYTRYPLDFSGFEGKSLDPDGYLEENPNVDFCDSLLSDIVLPQLMNFEIYPNPATQKVILEFGDFLSSPVSIYDDTGRLVSTTQINGNRLEIDLFNLPRGLYFIAISGYAAKKILVQ
jgi:arylsulfotransferase ASST/type IX secretion system substrate protein